MCGRRVQCTGSGILERLHVDIGSDALSSCLRASLRSFNGREWNCVTYYVDIERPSPPAVFCNLPDSASPDGSEVMDRTFIAQGAHMRKPDFTTARSSYTPFNRRSISSRLPRYLRSVRCGSTPSLGLGCATHGYKALTTVCPIVSGADQVCGKEQPLSTQIDVGS